jgi:hypothetical protein
MSALEVLRETVDVLERAQSQPYGPPATADDEKVAKQACMHFCGGDRDKAISLWKLIEGELGYVPHAACVALYRAAFTENLVPHVEAPVPS